MQKLYQRNPLDFNSLNSIILVPSRQGTVLEVMPGLSFGSYCSHKSEVYLSKNKLAIHEEATAGIRPAREFRISGVDRTFVLHEQPNFQYILSVGENVVVYSTDLLRPKHTIPTVTAKSSVPFEDWRFSHPFPPERRESEELDIGRIIHDSEPINRPISKDDLVSHEEKPKWNLEPPFEPEQRPYPEARDDPFAEIRAKLERSYGGDPYAEALAKLAGETIHHPPKTPPKLNENFIEDPLVESRTLLERDPIADLKSSLRAEEELIENLKARTRRIVVQGMQVLDANGNVKFKGVYAPGIGFEFR